MGGQRSFLRILRIPTLTAMFAAAVLALAGAASASAAVSGPTITTDQNVYSPSSMVLLSGSGWQPGEAVHLYVNDSVGNSWSWSDDVTADSTGAVADSLTLPSSFIATYSVTATGSVSGTATATFSDDADTITGPAVANVSPNLVTYTAAKNGKSCTAPSASWSVQGGAQITSQTSTTASVKFTAAGPVTLTNTWSGTDNQSQPCTVSATLAITVNNPDTTPPTLSATHTPDLSNGWNTSSPVTETIKASDSGSGLAGAPTCTDGGNTLTLTGGSGTWTTTVSGDGTHSISCSVADNAANASTANDTVKIDTTAPSLIVSHTADGNAGWNVNAPATVTVAASDSGSGLAGAPSCTDGTTNVTLTGGSGTWTASVSGDGTHNISCSVSDATGHTKTASDSVKLDTAAPSLSVSHTADGSGGWNLGKSVTVAVAAGDSGSGLSSSPSCTDGTTNLTLTGGSGTWTTSVSGDGTHNISCSVADAAGNPKTAGDTVKIDSTAPAASNVTATSNGSPYTAGTWTSHSVTVSWDCTDSGSGAVKAHDSQTLSSDTSTGSVTPTCADNAGNTGTGTAFGPIKIDTIAPAVSNVTATSNGAPYTAGTWTDQAVTVSWNCTDSGSGPVSAYSTQALTTDTSNGSITPTCADNAGNTASGTAFGPIKIDTIAPTVSNVTATSNGSPYTAGTWTNHSVTVSWDCTDSGSGAVSSHNSQTLSTDTSNGSITPICLDNAGNVGSGSAFSPIQIDTTAPAISNVAASSNGNPYSAGTWTNQAVTVSWDCTDSGSGAVKAHDSQTLSTDTSNGSITPTCADNAGNTASGTAFGPIKIDTIAPTVSNVTATSNGSPYTAGTWTNHSVTVSWDCTDAGSGAVKASDSQSLSSDTSTGSVTPTCLDNAGNLGSGSAFGPIKIDTTAPTISNVTATSNGAPYTAGTWTNHSVTVSWNCTDSGSGAVKASDSQTLTTDTSNGSVAPSCADNAGNTGTAAAVTPIEIDTTAPTISNVTATSNGNPYKAGTWTNHSVTVSWDCTDSGSGAVKAHDSQTLTTDTSTGTVTPTCADNAGNTGTGTAFGPIQIDTTPPVISNVAATSNGNPYTAGTWTNHSVTVSWDCTDSGSGAVKAHDSQTLTTDTSTGSVTPTCADNVGNTASGTPFAPVQIDTVPPALGVSHTADGNAGWNVNAPVTVTITASDSGSGLAGAPSCKDGSTGLALTGGSGTWTTTVSGDGTHAISCSAADIAGNGNTASDSVNIDTTAPTVSNLTTTSNGNPYTTGAWTNHSVTVSWDCTDSGSGAVKAHDSQTLSGDTSNGSVTPGCADNAGNIGTAAAVTPIEIDTTAPAISNVTATSNSNPYSAGTWTNHSVTVSWDCTDSGSGPVKAHDSQILSSDTSNGSVTPSCADNAGNTASGSAVSPIRIDTVAPALSVSHTPDGQGGWNVKAPVTVTISASDSGSGLAGAPSCTDGTTSLTLTGGSGTWTTPVSGDGTHNISCSVSDNASNPSAANDTVKLDTTAPAVSNVTATSNGNPYTAGTWTNHSVTVSWNCTDGGSGTVKAQDSQTLSSNTSTGSVTPTCADNAGNTGTATAVAPIKIDTTAPTVVCVTPTPKFILKQSASNLGAPTVSAAVTDSLSGATAATASAAADTSSITLNGTPRTVAVTGSDQAGNSTTVQCPYTVIYQWNGFLQPINDTAHNVGQSLSIFKAGSTIPAKLQLLDATGAPVQESGTDLPGWLTPQKGSALTAGATVDETVYSASATSGSSYRWDSTNQQYIYNYNTAKSQSGTYWRVGVTLDDGQTYYVSLGLL